MKKHNCENCAMRAKYDQNPGSFVGRFWRWHINWCPGWKGYMELMSDEDRNQVSQTYKLKK